MSVRAEMISWSREKKIIESYQLFSKQKGEKMLHFSRFQLLKCGDFIDLFVIYNNKLNTIGKYEHLGLLFRHNCTFEDSTLGSAKLWLTVHRPNGWGSIDSLILIMKIIITFSTTIFQLCATSEIITFQLKLFSAVTSLPLSH